MSSAFLAWTILLLIGEYAVLVLIVATLFNIDMHNRGEMESSIRKFFEGPPFSLTGLSYQRGCWSLLLGLYRMFCFCYFLSVAFIWSVVRTAGQDAIFFSLWHVFLIVVYFFMASVASLLTIARESNIEDSNMSINKQVSASALQIVFEVAGGTSYFVTLAVFLVHNHHLTFWNVTHHLVISLAMTIELFLNRIPVRWEHILLNEAWLLTYAVVMWPIVVRGAWMDYPYNFLNTDSTSSLIQYSIAAAVSTAMYLAWCLVAKVRDGIISSTCGNRSMETFEEMDEIAPQSSRSAQPTSSQMVMF